MRISAIVPVKDREALLGRCLDALVAAQADHGNVTIVVVDNDSTDRSREVAASYSPYVTLVHSSATRVGGVRNAGARAVSGSDAFAFIDSDCIVPAGFFREVERAFIDTRAAAVGCEVVSPHDGHWTELVADRLHRPGGDGPRRYINSACFCIRAEWFDRLGGFSETMISSEDVDICRRLTTAGGVLVQREALAVLHLGNPQTLKGFYRRLRWHGEGILQQGRIQPSLTGAAMLGHLLFLTLGSVIAGVLLVEDGRAIVAAGTLAAAAVAVPTAFVIARAFQFRRRVPVIKGIALMSVSLLARIHGFFRSVASHT